MRLHARDTRLVPVAAATWAASLAAIFAPQAAGWLAIALWSFAVGGMAAAAFRRGRGEAGVSTIVVLSSMRDCGTAGVEIPRADCAAYDRAMTAARASWSRASSSLMSSRAR